MQEIGDLELTVSLPSNMCGVVAISNVSDPMTEDMEEAVEGGEGEGEKVVCDDRCKLYCLCSILCMSLHRGWQALYQHLVGCSTLANS